MGIDIPGTIEFGDDCNDCEVSGPPLWANGETPKYVKVVFSGIKLCIGDVDVPTTTFILKQFHLDPCAYEYIPGVGGIDVRWSKNIGPGPACWWYQGAGANIRLFRSLHATFCKTNWTNDFVQGGCNGGVQKGYDGIAQISWGPGINEKAFDGQ